MRRVVLDTGIYIQAAITTGQGHWLLREAERGTFEIVTSAKQLYEVEQTLQQEAIRAKSHLTPDEEQEFLVFISKLAEMCADPKIAAPLTHDLDDNWLVALAQINGIAVVTRETSIHKHHPDDVEVLLPDDFSAELNDLQ